MIKEMLEKVIYMYHIGGTLCFSYIENLGKLSEMCKRALMMKSHRKDHAKSLDFMVRLHILIGWKRSV